MTAETTPQPFQPKLVSFNQVELNEDSGSGARFAPFVGVDGIGNFWTTVGVMTDKGFMLQPWVLQPRPSVLPPLPEETPAPAPVQEG